MLDAYKNSVAKQYEAAFCTLNRCIDRCPEDSWNAPVANWKFCQVANHVLFYSDLYLGADKKTFRDQPAGSSKELILDFNSSTSSFS